MLRDQGSDSTGGTQRFEFVINFPGVSYASASMRNANVGPLWVFFLLLYL